MAEMVSEAGAASEREYLAGWRALAAGRWPVVAALALGALVRLGLILAGWPATDSDEGTMGLMALHIRAGHDFPLMFYGQVYMGTLQAYLGALLFAIFGPSTLTLRLGLLLLYVLFTATMYALVHLLYDRWFALLALGLLALGGPDLLHAQLLALGGYPETLLFSALALLLASWLAITPTQEDGRPRGWRLAAWAGVGLTLGLGLWSDLLILPFVLAAPLPLLLSRRREARWRGLGAAALGLVVGFLPQIIFTLTHPHDNTPSAVAAFQPHGVATLAQLPGHLFIQIAGTLFVSLPNISGAGWVCALPVSPQGLFAGWSGAGLLACAAGRLAWSAGLLALGVVAARAAWRTMRTLRAAGDARQAAVQAGRLALLLGGALVLAFYIASPQAGSPLGNARYLIGTQIALPALLWPLWEMARRRVAPATWGAWVALALLALVMACGVTATYAQAAGARASAAADHALARDLERLGVRHMYTDYWTCYKTTFLTQERLTCAVLNARMQVAQDNRYPPYVAAVQADPRAAYVFPAGSPQAAALARTATASSYLLTRLDGYVIYLPKG